MFLPLLILVLIQYLLNHPSFSFIPPYNILNASFLFHLPYNSLNYSPRDLIHQIRHPKFIETNALDHPTFPSHAAHPKITLPLPLLSLSLSLSRKSSPPPHANRPRTVAVTDPSMRHPPLSSPRLLLNPRLPPRSTVTTRKIIFYSVTLLFSLAGLIKMCL